MKPRAPLDEKLLEENLEELYENAPCGYVSLLPDGTFARVNRTFLHWVGYERAALIGVKRFQELLSIPGQIYYETHFAPLLQMQGSVNEVAFDLICQDRRRLPVLLNATLKCDAVGEPLLIRATLFNATDRREYERELLLARNKAEQAAQAKAHFLSTISHEIRTPLSIIALAAQLLARHSDDPKQQRYIRTLESATESLLALVNDILDFSRLEAGKVVWEARAFDPHALIRDLLTRFEVKASAKGIAVEATIDERLPQSLLGDALKISQVLTNLLGNAVKFTNRGEVRLTVAVIEQDAETVLLEFAVRDTGIGIAPDHLAHIFDIFTQASSDITMKFGGTGLGLAISQQILRLCNSEITVTSRVGEGSTFAFPLRLPRGPA